ncbi:unnamed protein product, partial [Prunus brigantina]
MDKSWIDLTDRSSNQYLNGLESFLDFGFDNNMGDTRIYCPCKKCYNRYFVTREVARAHIIVDGFWSKYKNWTHGQRHQTLYVDKYMGNSSASVVDDDIIGMVHEAFEHPNLDSSIRNDGSTENEYGEGPNDETTNYFKLL